MTELNEKTKLIVKCIDFYINYITSSGEKCPSISEMREIVKLDDIKLSITSPKENK